MKYIAKKDTWFKEGTESFREEPTFDGHAIYRGIYIVGPNENYDTFWHDKGYKEGDEVEMREHCSDDEFQQLK